MDRPAVEVVGLVKRYARANANAVDGVSFAVAPGEVFALLGPNGAGKTTTIGVLTTRVLPTAGRAYVGGVDVVRLPVEVRKQIAVVPQRNNLDRGLSIRDNLVFHGAYHGLARRQRRNRANALLAQFGLLERAGERPDYFSGGESQRVMIARALMHAPRVLFLDEPTSGLDPAARLFVWDRLRELRERGVTLVLTTHDMHEASTLAGRVGIMDHGRLLALDAPRALVSALPGKATLELALDGLVDDDTAGRLGALAGVQHVERVDAANGMGAPGGRIRLYLAGDAASMVAPAATLLASRGLTVRDVSLGEPALEDVFIELTGRALR